MTYESRWEAVIGLELHVQLNTAAKIFSSAPVGVGFAPNQAASIVDLAFPGTLPVLNQEVLVKAIRFGLAITADIASQCRFDRKSYFYPDLPKGYQITQLNEPIVGRGTLNVQLDDGSIKPVDITRAHLEEDAGKSVHDRYPGQTAIDLNRAGTPLLEIVTEPQLHSPEEAAACFRQLHTLVTWLGICDGNLNEGSMRCDANVSVRLKGNSKLGERTEIKNINSFRFVQKALQFEIQRQIAALERGDTLIQETRLYDVARDETRPMREKEFSDDYRYFPDPDLLPVSISEDLIHQIRETMPELPAVRRERYVADLLLDDSTAARLTRNRETSDYFERTIDRCPNPKLAANWIVGVVSAALNKDILSIEQAPVNPDELGEILLQVDNGSITQTAARQVFQSLWSNGGSVEEALASQKRTHNADDSHLRTIVQSILDSHPKQLEQLKGGRKKIAGFFVGQIMKETGGSADPRRVNEILSDLLLDEDP